MRMYVVCIKFSNFIANVYVAMLQNDPVSPLDAISTTLPNVCWTCEAIWVHAQTYVHNGFKLFGLPNVQLLVSIR
jgi:hypothetical protein